MKTVLTGIINPSVVILVGLVVAAIGNFNDKNKKVIRIIAFCGALLTAVGGYWASSVAENYKNKIFDYLQGKDSYGLVSAFVWSDGEVSFSLSNEGQEPLYEPSIWLNVYDKKGNGIKDIVLKLPTLSGKEHYLFEDETMKLNIGDMDFIKVKCAIKSRNGYTEQITKELKIKSQWSVIVL